MQRVVTLAAAVVFFAPVALTAQQSMPSPAGPFAAAMQSAWQRAARNMPAAADEMPADKYGFKPTPEQMSFGEIIAHETQSNRMLCGALAGGAAPSESHDATASKDELVSGLRASFEYCSAIVAGLTEASLGDSVPFFGGRKATKARAALALAQDWADHYAQAAMYLRLNDMLPPSARRRQ